MQVNALVIKNLRTQRAYTQQHLADACAVSLRTIQRVERYGTASSETLMSLSAVFEVKSHTLMAEQQHQEAIAEPTNKLFILWIVIATGMGGLIGALLTYYWIN